MHLTSRIVPITRLSPGTIDAMFTLMERHYENVFQDTFRHDLSQKTWAILLEDAVTHRLCGFSTQQLYRVQHGDGDVRVVFSGDTIIDRACWGSQQLPLAFGQLMLSVLDAEPQTPLYWFLISKGHRTYRYLPVFYQEYYPHPRGSIPPRIKALMDLLAVGKFGPGYRAGRGILKAGDGAQRLRPELATVEEGRIRHNPHTAFFLERNPGYAEGDELICLAPFSRENLKPFILRALEKQEMAVA